NLTPGRTLDSGDLPAPGAGRGVGLVLVAVLALVVDREPGVTTGFLAHPTRLEGTGGAVVTRDRTATDVGDFGFRHHPAQRRGTAGYSSPKLFRTRSTSSGGTCSRHFWAITTRSSASKSKACPHGGQSSRC